jgi:glycosyltransferase involved in cell wall biosynthesis
MRPGEASTPERISDEDMSALLASASLVVVPSFDEGLSLPVIEALRAGAPVVASDIPAHRELLGSGSFLADPRSPKSMSKAIRRHRGRAGTRTQQLRRLSAHRHATLESVIASKLQQYAPSAVVEIPPARVYTGGRPLSVGIATPWPPQRSGVADFAAATTIELARLCDVTVYTTHDADVAGTTPSDVRIKHARIDEVLERGSEHDVFVSIVGNSHFHVPFIELLGSVDSVVITHDTRLVELYMATRGKGGLEQLMLRGTGQRELRPSLDDQIDDMRLLQNAGFWEVARRARLLASHSPSTVERITAETGVAPKVLPFANYRQPDSDYRTGDGRAAARARLGFDEPPYAGTVHLATFGFVDVRTKLIDVVVESAAWLTQWGHRVSLHVVGSASPGEAEELTLRAAEAGIANFQITGYVSDEEFRDYLLAVDLGLQLRVSPLLGVSGPLSDMAAYGTPALGSRGLCTDVDTPDFIDRLPDDVSPVTLAEAIEYRLANPIDGETREAMRSEYLARKSPAVYARAWFEMLSDVGRTTAPGEA